MKQQRWLMCVRQERQRLEERRNIFLLTKELKNICLWQVGVSGITVSYAIDNAYIYTYSHRKLESSSHKDSIIINEDMFTRIVLDYKLTTSSFFLLGWGGVYDTSIYHICWFLCPHISFASIILVFLRNWFEYSKL